MFSFIKQPLVHFIILGMALFVIHGFFSSNVEPIENKKILRIDRQSILTFMQYRAKVFDKERFSKKLDAMSDNERKRLIDDLIREQVLYRHAKALKLERDDYVIKRRLIQKVEFIIKGFVGASINISDKKVKIYYEAHKQDYKVDPSVIFTHVFFNKDVHGKVQAQHLAKNMLGKLNVKKVGFSEAVKYGDRFVYHLNYVERVPEYISAHFGKPMSDAIFALPVKENKWQGPFESSHGYHLVKVINKQSGFTPLLSTIEQKVQQDARQDLVNAATESVIQEITNLYRIHVSYKKD